MGNFKAGDRVQLIDELTEGVVLETGKDRLRIQTGDGFELEVAPEEVIHLPGAGSLPLEVPDMPPAPKEADRPKKGRAPRKSRQNPPVVLDLHIEKLLPDTRGMSTYDILDYQLETARRQLEFALRKRIQRVVFIHGVGEGVLRAELRTLCRRYEGLKAGDADYREYGMGATEVYIPQSSFL